MRPSDRDLSFGECEKNESGISISSFEIASEYRRNSTWQSIAALANIKSFTSDLQWISRKIKSPMIEVAKGIEGLLSLGILVREKNHIKRILKFNFHSANEGERVKEHVLLANQIIAKLSTQSVGDSQFLKNQFVATDEAKHRDLQNEISAAIDKFVKESSNIECDRVVAISVTGVTVSKLNEH